MFGPCTGVYTQLFRGGISSFTCPGTGNSHAHTRPIAIVAHFAQDHHRRCCRYTTANGEPYESALLKVRDEDPVKPERVTIPDCASLVPEPVSASPQQP